jgi:hypothetical protein
MVQGNLDFTLDELLMLEECENSETAETAQMLDFGTDD